MIKRRRTLDGRFYEPGNSDTPRCNWPGCWHDGLYRAPKSRKALYTYHWFCMDHVRKYNASWNYYKNMNQAQIEQEVRGDLTGHRPTWRMGTRTHPDVLAEIAVINNRIGNIFGCFETDAPPEKDGLYPRRGSPEDKALSVLDLNPPITLENLKIHYKKLVKRYHPDANNGDKDAEERFKKINTAYQTLVNSLSS